MEACFSQLTLDVIGKAVFNYEFNALNADSPLIQVQRSTHFIVIEILLNTPLNLCPANYYLRFVSRHDVLLQAPVGYCESVIQD